MEERREPDPAPAAAGNPGGARYPRSAARQSAADRAVRGAGYRHIKNRLRHWSLRIRSQHPGARVWLAETSQVERSSNLRLYRQSQT